MTLSSALNTALTGLGASTTAAQIISGNIANAQTAGYTQKSINLSEISTGSGSGGVEISGYSRVSDSVLSATLNNSTSSSGYLSTQQSYMTQVQSILGSSSNPPPLSSAISTFQSAWTQLSAASDSITNQRAVVSAGQQVAGTVTSIATQISSLQTQVQTDLASTVNSLNTNLTTIQTLNTQISTALASHQPIGDLQDQRDQAINAVAAITAVQIMDRPNGGIALYTPGGTTLIDGQAQVFSASGNNVLNSIGATVTNLLTGGKLQAQTDFLSSSTSSADGIGVIGKMTSQLKNFANTFTSTATGGFADTYNSATTNTGEQASAFFTAALDANGLPDISTFAVNSNLTSGTTTVKQASATAIANTFTATNLAINSSTNTISSAFTATGLTANNQTFSGIANAILSGFQQSANNIKTSSTTALAQQTYYQNALSSKTGVNTDSELVSLTNWQNSYAASAHVISTIQNMFKTLENMVG